MTFVARILIVFCLLLEAADMRDQRLDFRVAQGIAVRLHPGPPILLDAFLDRLGGFLIRETRLHGGFCEILHLESPAHGGIRLAIFSMTLGTVLIPIRLSIRRRGVEGGHRDEDCSYSQYFLHMVLLDCVFLFLGIFP